MKNHNNSLTKLAEAKMLMDHINETGHYEEDHIDVIEYIADKRSLKLRETEKNGIINLSNRIFYNNHMHAELKGKSLVDFSNSTLNRCFITNQDLSGSLFNRSKFIEGSVGKTNFDGSDFSYSDFHRVNAYKTKFTNCKFRYVKNFSEDSFFLGDFYGIDWRGTDFTGTNLSWIDFDKIVNPNNTSNTDFFEGCIGIDENILKQIKMNTIRKKMF